MLEDVGTTDLGNAQELMKKPPRPLRRPPSPSASLGGSLSHPLDGKHGLGMDDRSDDDSDVETRK